MAIILNTVSCLEFLDMTWKRDLLLLSNVKGKAISVTGCEGP
jgi:hypothetical protein